MRGRIELRLEDADGNPVGEQPAWQAEQRQFLWEVVHDTRGILRKTVPAEDVALIRTVDATGGSDEAKAVDAEAARDAYRRAADALKENADRGPQFHWVAPEGTDEWAAVCHVETDGDVVTVVGGWNRPVVREGAGEDAPTRPIAPGEQAVDVAGTAVRLRPQSFYDLFAADLERLVAVLDDAVHRGLRVRFVQR